MIKINDVVYKQKYEEIIAHQLFRNLWQMIYKPMFKVLDLRAQNDANVILDALKNGQIIFINGGFKGKFNNKLSKELQKIGAKWDRYSKSYKININTLDPAIVKYLELSQRKAQQQLEDISRILDYITMNVDQMVDTMLFNEQVKVVIDDSGNQVKQNVKHLNVIVPELSEERKQQIVDNYNHNMQYYIKRWTRERISKMREEVDRAILSGYREDEVKTMLMKEYNIGKNKAIFLARNETNIMLAELKKAMYTEMGFEEFIWKTRLDGLERPEHHKLNNTIWRFDEPPIIDERTGQRGLPGQTYNCRCNLIPVRR